MEYDQQTKAVLDDLEYLFKLSVSHQKLASAIRAKELIARITGVLVVGKKPEPKTIHLNQLTDEQIELLILEAKENTKFIPS
ncbi:MAG: hypothetical protein J0G29_04480 [Alphaproteobacteria bacterium]|nr:hypothetical protein [Alphaproteobacteria bacterium]